MALYHSPRGLYPFQLVAVANCLDRPVNMVVYDTGIGKALGSDQRVATPSGWRPISELSVGDLVFGSHGMPIEVTGVFPQGIRDLFRVGFNDGSSVVCDVDHLWSTRSRTRASRNDPYQTRTLGEIVSDGLRGSDGGHRHFIPVVEPIDLLESELEIDPYLLGVILGDGGITQNIRITTADPEIIQGLSLPLGVGVKKYHYRTGSTPSYALTTQRGQSNPLTDALRKLGVMGLKSDAKFVPEVVLWGSRSQRLACLQGLLDTDGYTGTSIEYCSVSRQLALDVVHLTQSLGGVASISEKQTTHQLAYRVRVSLPPGVSPFRLKRKVEAYNRKWNISRAITSVEPIGPGLAVCISVDSPDGLFVTEGFLLTHNTHIAMAAAAFLIEDGVIDHCLVVCEQNKLSEWVDDLREFTELSVLPYKGDKTRRERIRGDLPQVIVATYETVRNDCAVKGAKDAYSPGALSHVLEGNTLIVYDEVAKLRNRTSGLHHAHKTMVTHLRKQGHLRVIGLTATPMETGPHDYYNIGRIFIPEAMPTVKVFERDYVSEVDYFGNPCKFRNLSSESKHASDVVPFSQLFDHIELRKRKSDPDVVEQFPHKVEEAVHVDLDPKNYELYESIGGLFPQDFEDESKSPNPVITALRMVAGHPQAILHSDGKVATTLREEWGADAIKAIPARKTERMVEWITPIVKGQGAQVVVFTFFANAILPLLRDALYEAGISVAVNAPFLSDSVREQNKARFKSGELSVFLSSDAGSRGLNLPEATYVLHYEMPFTYAGYIQRSDRIHRIDSPAESVLITSMIASDTIEDGISNLVLKRNKYADLILEDGEDVSPLHLTAEERRELLDIKRKKKS